MRTPARLFDRQRRTPYEAGERLPRVMETAEPTPEAKAREELVLAELRRAPGDLGSLTRRLCRDGFTQLQLLAALYVLTRDDRAVLSGNTYSIAKGA